MFWTLELASYLEDAPWPATKDELIDYSIRSGAPIEVVENLQELEDEGDVYETIEDIWPDYPTQDDFLLPKLAPAVQARRAERLVLALDRLLSALEEKAGLKPASEKLNELFKEVQSLPDFDAAKFAARRIMELRDDVIERANLAGAPDRSYAAGVADSIRGLESLLARADAALAVARGRGAGAVERD